MSAVPGFGPTASNAGDTASRTDITESPEAVRASPADCAAQRRAEKVAGRRDDLARATLKTLAVSGYARTSLREIAANSGYSHGVLHYYFADKLDLIMHCVRLYKGECVSRYDDLVAESASHDELRERFAQRLGETLVEDNEMHRLWYDVRSQSMFEPAFAADVREIDIKLEQMVRRVIVRYADLAHSTVTVDSRTAYSAMDGLFTQAMIAWSHGDSSTPEVLRQQGFDLLPRLIA